MKGISLKEKSYINNDEYYYRIIRKNIRKFRLEQSLTQQDLADMTELSREYICDIENESRGKHLTISVLGRIAEALNIDIRDFFVDNNE
jgi:transcriptional regulator with XRE-family HTH domain